MTDQITFQQCKAARALLSWTQQHLADVAGLNLSAVRDFERENRRDLQKTGMTALIRAFDDGGIEFIDNSGVKLG